MTKKKKKREYRVLVLFLTLGVAIVHHFYFRLPALIELRHTRVYPFLPEYGWACFVFFYIWLFALAWAAQRESREWENKTEDEQKGWVIAMIYLPFFTISLWIALEWIWYHPIIAWGSWGFLTFLILMMGIFGNEKMPANERHVRGGTLLTYKEASKRLEKIAGEGGERVFFGMLYLPDRLSVTHFLVVGATGSGKTITIRQLMESVLPKIGKGNDKRALIYDAKQDSYSIVKAIAKNAPVYTLNPFDRRCAAWDMAKDITAPATAEQIATILVPPEKNSTNPFFSDAARALLTGVFQSFILTAEGKWTFRDVVLALKSAARLKAVLGRTDQTKDLIESYFSNERTANDVISTVATKIQRYQYIAAAWEKAESRISLRDWLSGESVLILGNDEAMRSALDAINQVIFKRLTELILAQQESSTRRTWIFLDELRQAGRLDGLNSLLSAGRSKGTCVVVGFQDIEGLSSVYGEKETNEIAGLCANKAILRSDSPHTAEWASSVFDKKEVYETFVTTGSTSIDDKGRSSSSSTSRSEQLLKKELVLPGEILNLKVTRLEEGGVLPGYYFIPEIGAYFASIWGDSIKRDLIPPDPTVPNVEPRPEEDQYLRAWDEKDLERLGLGKMAAQIARAASAQHFSEAREEEAVGQEPSVLKNVRRNEL